MKEKIKNAFYIFLPIICGSIIGLIINKYIDYKYLNQPPLSPSSLTFPIAWSIIYLLLGVSYYLYKKRKNDSNLNSFYYFQLLVNYLWSILFFVFKLRLLSIVWIILLDYLVIMVMKKYYKYNKYSTYLLIPYLAWDIFATYLTIGIYILN